MAQTLQITSNRVKADVLEIYSVKTIVGRTNSITGLAYKDDPAIFGWELINEPHAPGDDTGNLLTVRLGPLAIRESASSYTWLPLTACNQNCPTDTMIVLSKQAASKNTIMKRLCFMEQKPWKKIRAFCSCPLPRKLLPLQILHTT